LTIKRLNLSNQRVRLAGQILDLLSDRSGDAGTGAARRRPASGTTGTRRDPKETVEEVHLLVERLGLGEQAICLGLQRRHLSLYSRGKSAGAAGAGELTLKEEDLTVECFALSQDRVGLRRHTCHCLRDDGGATAARAAEAEPGELPFEKVGPLVDRPRLGEDAVGL
jgi:hypothetical protein